ncbi:MAG: LOG family protein [Nitrospinae bacterium]|nr:LOG family protein [Nitrospinota bacterium]
MAGVIGSGSDPCENLSRPLGQWLAKKGFDLINGGGQGVMAEVARAFSSVPGRKGLCIGILPSELPCDSPERRKHYRAPEGYPNRYIDIPIHTHLHLSGKSGKEIASRNHIVVLTADIVVALPGSAGTRSEIELALDYGKPLVILNVDGVWDEFRSAAAHMARSVEETFGGIENLLAGLRS